MGKIFDFAENYFSAVASLTSIQWNDIVEILLIAFFVYQFMLWIRNTRAYSLLKGILIVFVFIRIIGIWAIVLSAVMSNILLDLSRYYVIRKDFENRRIRYLTILATLTLGILNSVLYFKCSDAINMIVFVISALAFITLNRMLLYDKWKMIKSKILRGES